MCAWLLSREGFSKGSFSSFGPPSLGLFEVCMLDSDLLSALCVWLLSREGFSKGPSSSSNHPSQALFKVCMPESDLFFALCVCDLIKGRLQQGLLFIVQSSFSRALQGKDSSKSLSEAFSSFSRSILLLKGPARHVCLNLIYLFTLCVWLLSREGFSKGSFSSPNHRQSSFARLLQGVYA